MKYVKDMTQDERIEFYEKQGTADKEGCQMCGAPKTEIISLPEHTGVNLCQPCYDIEEVRV